jgi:hypothetical protein
MIPLSALNVTRDIIDFKLELENENDEDYSSFKYYLSITKWDEYGMNVQLNFSDPLLVSRGVALD